MKFETVCSIAARLPRSNIDTDQIIPARFLKVTEKTGLGAHLFADWRPKIPDRAQILIAGHNFGCGSSREHAVWALVDRGFRVIISTGFGDIFYQNALKNRLLPIIVDSESHQLLLDLPASTIVTVHLASQTISADGLPTLHFAIDSFSKTCLLEDLDELGYVLKHEAAILRFEDKHP